MNFAIFLGTLFIVEYLWALLLQDVLVSQRSGLARGSVLKLFSSVTRSSCVMLSEDVKHAEGYLYQYP